MLTGRRFRVEFTDEQAVFAEQIGAACRVVWNTGLEQRREYRRRGESMNYGPQAHELAEAKTEHLWLKDVPGHCLQQTLMDLDRACREHGTWKVHWRSGRRWVPSFRFPEGNKMVVEKLNRRHARVKLPKLGWVKFRASRSLEGETIRSATLSRDGAYWFVSLLVEDGVETPTVHAAPGTAVGVDRGVVVAVATSDGELVDRAFVTTGERTRAVALQRRLSRAAKGSANRTKTRQALAKLRATERHRRQDFCAQTAHRLAHGNAVVVLEDLKIRNMTRRAAPVANPDNPGQFLPNGGSGKSGLNRAVLGKGWYRFEQALTSVSRYTGTQVIKVPAAFTSQRCSACGHVDPKSRESQAVFRCTTCSTAAQHADVNAAKNVLAAGLAVTVCRETTTPAGVAVTSTQEPAGNREELLLRPV
ncbi:IS891/IS1136/IS1341 family transposase [Mycolicibacterium fortuitum subsp. acetamidolyticum]|uniref:IS891/IS1136/IS1341 family transposase n=1 Tax=Mycolicibacterium fortuitum subsp. acetamidolyticum TaxID=144550 RepID=A0A124E4A9_MYCFO|nr:RNA-guided endonuclease TnpB family protein [Mycolicibacterium fortuitum]MCV7137689.1 transposase [Mycolicibacterium fortuitum]GAT02559.1 IS891/IS1136/IS1341 family transposase [Mycolicibacterium fortuitum subsp. acetamidolyticum]